MGRYRGYISRGRGRGKGNDNDIDNDNKNETEQHNSSTLSQSRERRRDQMGDPMKFDRLIDNDEEGKEHHQQLDTKLKQAKDEFEDEDQDEDIDEEVEDQQEIKDLFKDQIKDQVEDQDEANAPNERVLRNGGPSAVDLGLHKLDELFQHLQANDVRLEYLGTRTREYYVDILVQEMVPFMDAASVQLFKRALTMHGALENAVPKFLDIQEKTGISKGNPIKNIVQKVLDYSAKKGRDLISRCTELAKVAYAKAYRTAPKMSPGDRNALHELLNSDKFPTLNSNSDNPVELLSLGAQLLSKIQHWSPGAIKRVAIPYDPSSPVIGKCNINFDAAGYAANDPSVRWILVPYQKFDLTGLQDLKQPGGFMPALTVLVFLTAEGAQLTGCKSFRASIQQLFICPRSRRYTVHRLGLDAGKDRIAQNKWPLNDRQKGQKRNDQLQSELLDNLKTMREDTLRYYRMPRSDANAQQQPNVESPEPVHILQTKSLYPISDQANQSDIANAVESALIHHLAVYNIDRPSMFNAANLTHPNFVKSLLNTQLYISSRDIEDRPQVQTTFRSRIQNSAVFGLNNACHCSLPFAINALVGSKLVRNIKELLELYAIAENNTYSEQESQLIRNKGLKLLVNRPFIPVLDPQNEYAVSMAGLVELDAEYQLGTGMIAVASSSALLSTYLSAAVPTQRCIIGVLSLDLYSGNHETSVIWVACELVGASKWVLYYRGKTYRITSDDRMRYNKQQDMELSELFQGAVYATLYVPRIEDIDPENEKLLTFLKDMQQKAAEGNIVYIDKCLFSSKVNTDSKQKSALQCLLKAGKTNAVKTLEGKSFKAWEEEKKKHKTKEPLSKAQVWTKSKKLAVSTLYEYTQAISIYSTSSRNSPASLFSEMSSCESTGRNSIRSQHQPNNMSSNPVVKNLQEAIHQKSSMQDISEQKLMHQQNANDDQESSMGIGISQTDKKYADYVQENSMPDTRNNTNSMGINQTRRDYADYVKENSMQDTRPKNVQKNSMGINVSYQEERYQNSMMDNLIGNNRGCNTMQAIPASQNAPVPTNEEKWNKSASAERSRFFERYLKQSNLSDEKVKAAIKELNTFKSWQDALQLAEKFGKLQKEELKEELEEHLLKYSDSNSDQEPNEENIIESVRSQLLALQQQLRELIEEHTKQELLTQKKVEASGQQRKEQLKLQQDMELNQNQAEETMLQYKIQHLEAQLQKLETPGHDHAPIRQQPLQSTPSIQSINQAKPMQSMHQPKAMQSTANQMQSMIDYDPRKQSEILQQQQQQLQFEKDQLRKQHQQLKILQQQYKDQMLQQQRKQQQHILEQQRQQQQRQQQKQQLQQLQQLKQNQGLQQQRQQQQLLCHPPRQSKQQLQKQYRGLFQCKLCDLDFTNARLLQQHREQLHRKDRDQWGNEHLELPVAITDSKWICPIALTRPLQAIFHKDYPKLIYGANTFLTWVQEYKGKHPIVNDLEIVMGDLVVFDVPSTQPCNEETKYSINASVNASRDPLSAADNITEPPFINPSSPVQTQQLDGSVSHPSTVKPSPVLSHHNPSTQQVFQIQNAIDQQPPLQDQQKQQLSLNEQQQQRPPLNEQQQQQQQPPFHDQQQKQLLLNEQQQNQLKDDQQLQQHQPNNEEQQQQKPNDPQLNNQQLTTGNTAPPFQSDLQQKPKKNQPQNTK